MNGMPYYHVDVFSPVPFLGNGLIVFTEAVSLSTRAMQVLTQEMRQFESIFLQEIRGNTVRARIFTCEQELDFAGHPVLGAAATLHELARLRGVRLHGLVGPDDRMEWIFQLNKKTVAITTERKAHGYDGKMNQGKAEFGRVLDMDETTDILRYIGAAPEDLYPGLQPTIVSTGLPYLIVPLKDNQFRARVGAAGLDERLQAAGVPFIGLLDIASRTIRTGNNDGTVEDIATGSLAGPAGAFLVAHGLEKAGAEIAFRQGENLGRDSRLYVRLVATPDGSMDVMVKGSVCKIGEGRLEGELSYP